MYINIWFQGIFAVDAMEVHGINSYGEDPFISNGTDVYVKYSADKSIPTGIQKIK